MAKVLPNGEIEYIGRNDNQIQLRGFRIELGEIENHLLACEEIKGAVVIVKERDGDKMLVAYYVSEREMSINELRDHLSKKLPDYMLPSYYVHMGCFPLTQNGKLDRQALPEPIIKNDEDFFEPLSNTEKKINKYLVKDFKSEQWEYSCK